MRYLVLLFCFNLFTGGVLFNEVGKLPALLSHYKLHKQQTPDVSFFQFVRLHYGSSSHQNDPAHNHHSLPFHMHCGMSGFQMAHSLPAPQPARLPEAAVSLPELAAANFCYNRYAPTGFLQSLFQPPRV